MKKIKSPSQPDNCRIENLGNGINLEMVAIPGGTFWMGSPDNEEGPQSNESPQHQVTVKPFFMGKFTVTQAQWGAVMDTNPSELEGANLPVENVLWDDATAFCEKLSLKTGRSYRLPSEAEWEYACRGGTITPFHFGETIDTEIANYNNDDQETTRVGSFPANAFGLHDMHGNVWEWCADACHENYQGAPSDGSAWINKNGYQPRILRGGSFFGGSELCRSAFRYCSQYPEIKSADFGFRVVSSAR